MERQRLAFREFGIPARIATFNSKESGNDALIEGMDWA